MARPVLPAHLMASELGVGGGFQRKTEKQFPGERKMDSEQTKIACMWVLHSSYFYCLLCIDFFVC